MIKTYDPIEDRCVFGWDIAEGDKINFWVEENMGKREKFITTHGPYQTYLRAMLITKHKINVHYMRESPHTFEFALQSIIKPQILKRI